MNTPELRQLGRSGIAVSPIALGCWPIAGMASAGVNDSDSLAAITASVEQGVNFFDTAYCYGMNGESERLLALALRSRRDKIVLATKCGIEWAPPRQQIIDGRPATLRRQFEESLRRLATDHVELLYLHAPDPQVPVAESAGELKRLLDEGKALSLGASNVTLAQLEAFTSVAPLAAVQPPYNMLQRGIEGDLVPWCRARDVAVVVYWPLLKGLLGGRIPREHVFPTSDSRHKYPMFQGEEWQRNMDFVDRLRTIAADVSITLSRPVTVAQLVIAWTIEQPGITVALCGAKNAAQATENAGAAGVTFTAAQRSAITQALADRGEAVTKSPV